MRVVFVYNPQIGAVAVQALCVAGNCLDFAVREQALNRVVMFVDFEKLGQVVVAADKLHDFPKNDIGLVLFGSRAVDLRVLVGREIAIISGQYAV